MPLSKHYIDTVNQSTSFDFTALGNELRTEVPAIEFALLMGSAREGIIKPHSDIDLAVYTHSRPNVQFYVEVEKIVCRHVGPEVRIDIGILNHAEPVYRYEALKGRLLFYRDEERWLHFYSVTCREYEYQMFDYARQKRYRNERRLLCS